jgi:hypothetical protein
MLHTRARACVQVFSIYICIEPMSVIDVHEDEQGETIARQMVHDTAEDEIVPFEGVRALAAMLCSKKCFEVGITVGYTRLPDLGHLQQSISLSTVSIGFCGLSPATSARCRQRPWMGTLALTTEKAGSTMERPSTTEDEDVPLRGANLTRDATMAPLCSCDGACALS